MQSDMLALWNIKAVIVFWWLDWLHKACLDYLHKLHILIWNRLLGKTGCFNFQIQGFHCPLFLWQIPDCSIWNRGRWYYFIISFKLVFYRTASCKRQFCVQGRLQQKEKLGKNSDCQVWGSNPRTHTSIRA